MKRKGLFLLVVLGCIGMMACGKAAENAESFENGPLAGETEEWDIREEPEATKEPVATKEPEVQEEDGNYFLKGKTKELLSFEEVHFFGRDPLTLTADRVKGILETNGMQVRERETDWGYMTLEAYYPENEGTSITVWQYDEHDYVTSWSFIHRPERTGEKLEVGARDIRMHDSMGEVLNKVGFQNGLEAEAELKALVGESIISELSDAQHEQIEAIFYYPKENGLFIEAACQFSDDDITLLLWDKEYCETLTDYLSLRFARSKETEGAYVLVQFSVQTRN